jgi:hypothetical protein
MLSPKFKNKLLGLGVLILGFLFFSFHAWAGTKGLIRDEAKELKRRGFKVLKFYSDQGNHFTQRSLLDFFSNGVDPSEPSNLGRWYLKVTKPRTESKKSLL